MSLLEFSCSLEMAEAQPWSGLLRLLGSTQASRVMPVVKSREEELGTVTQELSLPVKDKAPPNLPAVDQVALVMVPLLPLPETSARTVPLPASKL